MHKIKRHSSTFAQISEGCRKVTVTFAEFSAMLENLTPTYRNVCHFCQFKTILDICDTGLRFFSFFFFLTFSLDLWSRIMWSWTIEPYGPGSLIILENILSKCVPGPYLNSILLQEHIANMLLHYGAVCISNMALEHIWLRKILSDYEWSRTIRFYWSRIITRGQNHQKAGVSWQHNHDHGSHDIVPSIATHHFDTWLKLVL